MTTGETHPLDRDTHLEPQGPGHYRAELSEAWWGYAAAHGGYQGALLLRAMQQTLADPSRPPRTLTVHFLRGPRPGAAELSVRILRSGSRLSALAAELHQQGRPVCTAVAAFGAPFGDEVWSDLTAPAAPDPGAVEPRRPSKKAPIDQRFEMRLCLGEPAFSGAPRARAGGWGRLRPPRAFDPAALVVLADGFWPALFSRLSDKREAGACPTVELTVRFRATDPASLPAPDAYVLVELCTHTLREGYLEESARLWSPAGVLLAEASQLAVRMLPRQR